MNHFSKENSSEETSSSHKALENNKNAEKQLRFDQAAILEKDELLENVFATPHMSIAYMDAKFNFIRVNHAYAKVDDRSPEEFIAKNHFELYPNQENQALFQKVVDSGQSYSAYAKPFQYEHSPERGVIYWDWTLQPIKDSSGKTTNLLLFVLDVTDRITALEKQILSEEKYRTLVENIPAVTWITNEYGITSYISPNVEQVYGFTSQEIYEAGDRLWFDRIHPDDVKKVRSIYQTFFQGEKKFDVEYRIRRKDGRWIWLHDRAIVTYEQEGEMLAYGIFSDITARKEAEIAKKDLEQRRAEFISLASHELRTPLTILKGYLDVMKKRYDDLSQEEKERCFHITDKNIYRLERLISGVGELAKIERGIFSLDTKVTEFNSYLSETIMTYKHILGDQLTYIHPTHDLPCFVEIDSNRLTQVLDNVIQNAMNHSSKANRKIVVECDTQLRDRIRISIRDNGAGIASTNLEKIFTPLISIPSPHTVQGAGIGLFLSKTIIEGHHGSIYAESQGLGKGTTFIIELPKKEI
ncbi:MAG: PAS domain S-box protein [Candidatus Hodarchaeota archaeon]